MGNAQIERAQKSGNPLKLLKKERKERAKKMKRSKKTIWASEKNETLKKNDLSERATQKKNDFFERAQFERYQSLVGSTKETDRRGEKFYDTFEETIFVGLEIV